MFLQAFIILSLWRSLCCPNVCVLMVWCYYVKIHLCIEKCPEWTTFFNLKPRHEVVTHGRLLKMIECLIHKAFLYIKKGVHLFIFTLILWENMHYMGKSALHWRECTHFSRRWVIHPQLSYSCLWWLLRVLVGWLFVCCVLHWPISIWSLVFRSINVWDFYIW
jgi:hypothetical protein